MSVRGKSHRVSSLGDTEIELRVERDKDRVKVKRRHLLIPYMYGGGGRR